MLLEKAQKRYEKQVNAMKTRSGVWGGPKYVVECEKLHNARRPHSKIHIQTLIRPPPDLVGDHLEYEVEGILKCKNRKQKGNEYLDSIIKKPLGWRQKTW